MGIQLTEKEELARKRVCLALDVPTVEQALELAKEVGDLVGTFKVGKELHTAAGNQGIPIVQRIFEYSPNGEPNVFLDLKLHDTPQTVYGAAKAGAVQGVYIFNLHIAGGEEMCKKAVDGAYDASTERGIERPKVIGVTELTSLDDKDLNIQGLAVGYDTLVGRRTKLAKDWGLDGIVCPASKAGELEKQFGSDWIYVTPGIKWAGKQGAGQKQLYTPDKAVQDSSSSILVIGSAITKADDRRNTAYEILKVMAVHL